MTSVKYHKTISLLLVFFTLIIVSSVMAETKTFVKEYVYQASEYDSKASARILALEQVKKLLLEQLGTYLESETEVKNFQITRDRIVAYTAGIVRTEIIHEKWDGKSYYLRARIQADPQQISKFINDLRKDRQKTQELEKSRKRVEELLQEVEILKKDLAGLKNKKSSVARQKLKNYRLLVNSISALDWYNVGKYYSDKFESFDMYDPKYAIVAFNRAIDLHPRFADAYVKRGRLYLRTFDNVAKAMQDFNMAIQIDPKSAEAWSLRHQVQGAFGNFEQALYDLNKAIEIKPDDSTLYVWRASYNISPIVGKMNYAQAIKDYTKVIELTRLRKFQNTYYSKRGDLYERIGDYQNALKDYDNGIDILLNELRIRTSSLPDDDEYTKWRDQSEYMEKIQKRGHIYAKLGNYQQAISDYDKVIKFYEELQPVKPPEPPSLWGLEPHQITFYDSNDELTISKPLGESTKSKREAPAEVYYYRGELYDKLGQHESASRDFDKVFELAPLDGAFIKAESLLKMGQHIESIKAVNSGIELALPRVPKESREILTRGHYFRAFVFKKLKNYQQALYELDKVLQKIKDIEAKKAFLLRRSGVYWDLGNYQGVMNCINEAVRIDPRDPLLFKVRGLYHLLMKEYQNVLADFEQVIRIDQKEKLNTLGDLARLIPYEEEEVWRFSFPAEQHKEIYKNFKIFSEKYPKFKKRYEQYVLDAQKSDPWQGKDSKRPQGENEWLTIGRAMRADKNYDEAIEACTKAIEKGPRSADMYILRGDVYFEIENYRAASKDYEKAISFSPDEIKFYYKHADACAYLGDYQKVISDFDMILKKRNSWLALLCRGFAYERLGKHEQALADYNESLEILPTAEGFLCRGGSRIVLGNFNQAIQDIDKSISIFLQDNKEQKTRTSSQRDGYSYIVEFWISGKFHHRPVFSESVAYYFRGLAYEEMGNHGQTIEDMKAAARLGSKSANEYLTSKGISW